MPAVQSLQWLDIADFSAGQWDPRGAYNLFATPTNAFVTLQDYHPLKGGGIRPWIVPTVIDLSPASLGANERIMGVFARNGAIRTGAGGSGNESEDLVLITEDIVAKKWLWYRRDSTGVSPTWSLRRTSAAASDNAHRPVDFAYFLDTNGVEWYCASIYQNGGDVGVWAMRIDYTVASNTGNDGAISQLSTRAGPICVSQARIMVGDTNGSNLAYGDVGLTTHIGGGGGTGGLLNVAPNKIEAQIVAASNLEPSDLLIGKSGSPWVQISGDVTSTATPVREMGDIHHIHSIKQQMPRTPAGVVFCETGGRLFETDGRNFTPLTNQLSPFPTTRLNNLRGIGNLGYLNSFLLCGLADSSANGIVYDFESGACFTTTQINPVFCWAEPRQGRLYAADHSSTPHLVYFDMFSGSRVSSGVLQTVPYADKNGRNIDIREVQLFVQSVVNSEFKVELIDESGASAVTRYAVTESNDRDMVKLQFPATKSDYLSVKITPRALDGTSEAPAIERLRIGFGMNNLISAR